MSHEICDAKNLDDTANQYCLSGDKPFFDVQISKSHVAKNYQLVCYDNPIDFFPY